MLIRGFDHVRSTIVAQQDEYIRLPLNIFDLSIAITYSNILTYIREKKTKKKEKREDGSSKGLSNYLYWTLSNFRNTRIVSAIEVTATFDSHWSRGYVEK